MNRVYVPVDNEILDTASAHYNGKPRKSIKPSLNLGAVKATGVLDMATLCQRFCDRCMPTPVKISGIEVTIAQPLTTLRDATGDCQCPMKRKLNILGDGSSGHRAESIPKLGSYR